VENDIKYRKDESSGDGFGLVGHQWLELQWILDSQSIPLDEVCATCRVEIQQVHHVDHRIHVTHFLLEIAVVGNDR